METNPLFNKIREEYFQYLEVKQNTSEKNILPFPSTEEFRLGEAIFNNLKEGGICTLVVKSRTSWNPESHYHKLVRCCAEEGKKINRLFLLPHRHCRHNKTLLEHIELDKKAGIIVTVLYVGDLISQLRIPLPESLEFGIWDEQTVCISVANPNDQNSIGEWRVSCRKEDLESYYDIYNRLKKDSVEINIESEDRDLIGSDLQEPMVNSAHLASELSSVLCKGNHISEDCSWYHSVWQYLRIFNMVSTPTWHKEFYKNSFIDFFSKFSNPKILISGTADYSLFAHIVAASENKQSDITVIDLCETPLFLCKWYAKFIQYPISTIALSIFEYNPPQKFDLITADAFITRFNSVDKIKILKKWNELLSEDGLIITTIRIESGHESEVYKSTPELANMFKKTAMVEAKKWKEFLDYTEEEMSKMVYTYAFNMVSYSFRSDNEALSLFTSCGFEIISLQKELVKGELKPTTYARIIAKKIKK